MTEVIHIIGNGESRKRIDFDNIDGFKMGCNAAYRDLDIDCLVAVDRRIVEEAIDNNFSKSIYTRRDWMSSFALYPNVRLLPGLPYTGTLREDDPWHWGTGPHACNLAATLKPREVHLWGFDLYGNGDRVNNIYKGTKNYDPVDKNAVDPRYWIYQIGMCVRSYPNIKWIQHQLKDWEIPKNWPRVNLEILEI